MESGREKDGGTSIQAGESEYGKRSHRVSRNSGQPLLIQAAGVAIPSFTSALLQEGRASEDQVMWTAGSLYGAAAETVSFLT